MKMVGNHPPRGITFGDIIEEHSRVRPGVLALVCGQERITWRELEARTARLASMLAGYGVGPGERVLWLGENCHRALELFIAAARLGAMFCAASVRDTAHENAFLVDDLQPKVVATTTAATQLADRVRELSDAAPHWLPADADPDGEYESSARTAVLVPAQLPVVDPESPLLVFYTAAYDGQPNGAMLSHRALLAQDLIFAKCWGYDHTTVFLNTGPFGYLGVWQGALPTLHFGGTNILLARPDPQVMCETIDREKVTRAFLAPVMRDRLIQANKGRRFDLSSLTTEPHSPAWDAMVTTDASFNPPGHGLGLTEVVGMGAAQCFGGDPQKGRSGKGWPTPLMLVRVVDDSGHEVPDGDIGILAMRGDAMMSGYWSRRETTAHVMADGWFHFHHCYVRREPDGSVAYAGVRERVIRTGGENVYPAEVERVIRTLPGVKDCGVLGVLDKQWGQTIRAVVVQADGSLTADGVIAHCREYLASFRKPRYVDFVDEVPRAADGNIDYAALDEQFDGGGYPGSPNAEP